MATSWKLPPVRQPESPRLRVTHLGFVHAAVVSVSARDDGYVERRDSQRTGERPEEQEVVLRCPGGGDATEIDLPVWCPPEVCQQLGHNRLRFWGITGEEHVRRGGQQRRGSRRSVHRPC
jgi:hypothetical protein